MRAGALGVGEVVCSAAPSARLARALAPFGLVARRGERLARADEGAVERILMMRAGQVVLVTGPSGCGKSTLLRALGREARARGLRVVAADAVLARRSAERAMIDFFSGPIGRAQRLLSLAGLGEAALWARGQAELSEGERARLALALAMDRADPGGASVLLLDEFCSTLDRPTARGVARALRAWSRAPGGPRIVCATSHDDLDDALRPDVTICPGASDV